MVKWLPTRAAVCDRWLCLRTTRKCVHKPQTQALFGVNRNLQTDLYRLSQKTICILLGCVQLLAKHCLSELDALRLFNVGVFHTTGRSEAQSEPIVGADRVSPCPS